MKKIICKTILLFTLTFFGTIMVSGCAYVPDFRVEYEKQRGDWHLVEENGTTVKVCKEGTNNECPLGKRITVSTTIR